MHFHASFATAAIVLAFHLLSRGRVCAGSIETDSALRTAFDEDARNTTTPWHSLDGTTQSPVTDGVPETETPRPREPTTVAGWLRDDRTTAAAGGVGGTRWNAMTPVADIDRAARSENRGWVQKLKGPARARSLKPLGPPTPATAAEGAAAAPVMLGHVLADVVYGTPWSVAHVSPKCAADVRTYNEHLQNFTLWAAKSE